MSDTCGAPKTNGDPCGSTVGLCPEHGTCANHDPCRREKMQEARSKGGRVIAKRKEAKHLADKGAQYLPAEGEPPAPPETAADAKAYLAWVLDSMARGKLGSALGRDMSTVADRFVRAVEKADLEARVAKLEAEAGRGSK